MLDAKEENHAECTGQRTRTLNRKICGSRVSKPATLGEVGGVSRNRLLVDKMIVWCTILGLIMASSQRQSHNLLAVFQMTDAKGLVIDAKKLLRCALLRQEFPASIS